jgi:AraC family transcriptional regulator
MQIAGVGRVIFWEGASLWIGLAVAPCEWHAHHAVQLCIGLNGPVQFWLRSQSGWGHHAAAVVPSQLEHMFQAPGKQVANLLIEPESAAGRQLAQRFRSDDVIAIAAEEVGGLAKEFAALFNNGATDAELATMSQKAVSVLSGSYATPQRADLRIVRATEAIMQRLDEPLTLAEIARVAGLSAGRFRHLFVAETGMPFRTFILWARLNRALELGYGGTSWTEAAHATNFADSAHLTRTCRRMLGLVPTSIRLDLTSTSDRLLA